MPEQSHQSHLPDFVTLYEHFQSLGNGPRADLRRVKTVDAIADLPAYYRWLRGTPDSPNLRRIGFLLPHVKHSSGAAPLGRQFASPKHRISEMRLFQVLRSEPPKDLEHLRRLVQQVGPSLDWSDFGKTLFFWGPSSKRLILKDFFTPKTEEKAQTEGEHHDR